MEEEGVLEEEGGFEEGVGLLAFGFDFGGWAEDCSAWWCLLVLGRAIADIGGRLGKKGVWRETGDCRVRAGALCFLFPDHVSEV